MSEKKLSDILREQMDRQEQQIKTQGELIMALETKLKLMESSTTSTKQHKKHSAEIEFDCPECQKAYDAEVAAKARPQIMQEIREKQKNMRSPELCEDCGEVYDRETEEDCPTCHRK